MEKAKKRKAKRKVLLREMTELGEGYGYAPNPGLLYVYTDGRGKGKTVSIYGGPKGMRFLAALLNNVADVNQSQIPDRNCPPSVGVHYHFNVRNGLHPKSSNLVFGRLDAKGDGSHEWMLPTTTTDQ